MVGKKLPFLPAVFWGGGGLVDVEMVTPAGEFEAVVTHPFPERGKFGQGKVGPLAGKECNRSRHGSEDQRFRGRQPLSLAGGSIPRQQEIPQTAIHLCRRLHRSQGHLICKQQVRDIELSGLIIAEIPLEPSGNLKGFLPERCYIHHTIYLMKTRFIWIVCGGLLMAGTTFAQFMQPQPEWQSVSILQTVNPIFPYRLQQLAVGTGEARVAINTDATGKLVEWLVVGYTLPEFADAAVSAIKQWKFEPARWRGEPVGTTIELIFSYEAKGVVVSTASLDEQMEALFLRLTEGCMMTV